DPDRVGAVLPRPRRPGPDARLGADGGGGPAVLHRRLVGGDLPRPCDPVYSVHLQPARRRAARPAGPETDVPAMRLAITGLQVSFGDRRVVDIDELHVGAAEIVGLAGESGSGKSMTTLAVLGLAHTVGATVRGSIALDGTELTGLSQRALRDLRGRRIAAIFQSPATAFSPVFKVGSVVHRALRLHGMSKDDAAEAASRAMREVLLSPGLLDR